MIWAIAAAAALVLAFLILLPLRRAGRFLPAGMEHGGSERRKLREEKAAALLALRELDFDYEMGKLSADDYKTLKSKYEANAVGVLKRLDAAEEAWKKIQRIIDTELAKRLGLLLFFLLFSSIANAETDVRSSISGKVFLRTAAGERPLSKATVRIAILKGEYEVGGAETFTDAGGNYRFPNLKTEPEYLYLVRAEQGGVPYFNIPAGFRGSKAPRTLPPITVYPATGSPDRIEATETMQIETGRNNLIKITESITFENRGDAAYNPKGDGAKPIEISLLKGGFDLDFLQGLSRENAEIDPSGLLRPGFPILPGAENRRQIRFSYLYPYASRSVPFSLPMTAARKGFDLVVAGKNLRVSSPVLERQLPQVYSGGPFSAGEAVRFDLSGLWIGKHTGFLMTAAGLAAVILLGAFLFIRRPAPLSPGEQKTRWTEAAYGALAELERNRGKISEAEYLAEKERLREILFELLREAA